MGIMIPAGIGLFFAVMVIFITGFLTIFVIGLLIARGNPQLRGRRRRGAPWWPSEIFDASRMGENNPAEQPHQHAHSATDSSASHAHHAHQHHHHHQPSMPDTTSHHHMPSMPDMSSHHHTGGFDAGAHSGGSHHSH